ncbi:ATP-binding protein [Nocardioides okcheonensis]|uniref:ATP-binding protein n=1 Tax=Nocardioides okcheonensis TaxID=2894081 RepID=UPI001E455D24|nr:ATP-binding protein [Nocardioides okcheonensis]UFN44609.1 hypothetical protein LN652_21630 [Nocardioides okcheonensis]
MTTLSRVATPSGVRRLVLGHTRAVDTFAALMLVGAITVYVLDGRTLVHYAVYLGVLVFNTGSAVVATVSAPRGRRLVPGLIATGVGLAVLGDVLCKIFDAGGATTDLSVADPAWLASYVVLCVALLVVLVRSGVDRRGGLSLAIDGTTVVAVGVLVTWTLAIGRFVNATAAPAHVRLVWAAYPLLQAVLLALVLMAMIVPRARRMLGPGFAIGVGFWLTTNIIYIHAPSEGGYVAAGASWMVAVVLMARTAWLGEAGTAEEPDETSGRAWLAPLAVGVLPLFVPPALEVLSDSLQGEGHPYLLAVSSTVLITLAFVRTYRLMRAEQDVLRDLEVARDEALAASRAKSMFVATMSHELRTPLTTVLACAEMLEDTPLTQAQRDLVHRMRRAGGLLQSLVEDILDFSRMEAGHVELAAVPFDLHALAAELAEANRARARFARVDLDLHIGPDVPRAVVGDPARLMQVAGNLLDNALKFTDAGRVRLDLRRSDNEPALRGATVWVEVVVSDTGIGIARDRLDSIFSVFEQVDGTTTRRHGGSGLGLAIAHQLVTLMGGSLRVRSELAVGSEFVAELPLVVGDPDPAAPAVPVQAGSERLETVRAGAC